jgi:protein Tex
MTYHELIGTIADELKLQPHRVAGAVRLLDEGNTIPFIARYRKEITDSLDEEELRNVADRLAYLRSLGERKQAVLASIQEQGKLTAELEAAVMGASILQQVEDLYLPYRPKRRTRATVARERGLEPLARTILSQPLGQKPADLAAQFLGDEVADVVAALAGARDIVAEEMAETAEIRQYARHQLRRCGRVVVKLAKEGADEQGKYELYHRFSAPLDDLQPHQLLAINRGESEKVLRVSFEGPDEAILRWAEQRLGLNVRSPLAAELREAVADGTARLLAPAIEREVHRALTESADDHAIVTFQHNLRNLLLQPPLKGRTVMGIDPGYRTGCKVSVCDATGKVLDTATIYPHEPQRHRVEALAVLVGLVRKHRVEAIAIGNGTASRETEQLAADLLHQLGGGVEPAVAYALVSEAGASVYSASPLARKELPDLDVSMRGAVSIARRLQDPLAELVKIDPKSIGVGLYQHDVDQKKLAAMLDSVVESVVNSVGVNANTASPALLTYVAGLNSRLAENVVAYRDEHGPFRNRRQLLQVKGIGPKSFEQAAGFLRIPDGDAPLDNTAIHPESYGVVSQLVEHHGSLKMLPLDQLRSTVPELARQLAVGEPTLRDILDALAKPGRDPRDDLPAPILRTDVLSLDDLQEGMVLKGTVRNVVDFGAFVDIGVKQDGLVHISQMASHYVQNPHDVVRVGDVVDVRVIKVDKERGRVGLSMLL